LPALLALVSVGSAGAARAALAQLTMPLLFLSSVSLVYAHHRAWVRRETTRAGLWILVLATLLVVGLWVERFLF